MRKISLLLLTCLILANLTGNARTYYVKAAGSNATSGLSDATAWNYAYFNSKTVAAGDTVLFKRGDSFFGAFKACTGAAGKPVCYGAYGTGTNPVITGLLTLTTWANQTSKIVYADLTAYNLPTVNLVTINGGIVGMGRYPNTGYLPYTGHTGNSLISGNAITNLPFNATGGEAVVRKVRWILDRHPITMHKGNGLLLGATSPYGGSLSYEAVDKNGFFIQNHMATLDREGEWYYDRTAQRLYIVRPATAKSIRVGAIEKLLVLNSQSNISFSELDFEGSNTNAVSITGGTNILFNKCRFSQHGQTAVYGNNAVNVVMQNCIVQNCLNGAVWIETAGNGVKMDNVLVQNIGTIPGAGRSGDGAQQGISIDGNNTSVRNCVVRKIGYNGIHFNGSFARIENNLIDSFCLVKDDGGGIYTYENPGEVVSDRIVRNNIVLNAIGNFSGAESYYYEALGKAAGIYLDGNSNHTEVSNNVIAHGAWAGFFVNNNGGNQFLNNLVYDQTYSIFLLEGKTGNIRNMLIKGNECIAKTPTQKTMYVKIYEEDSPGNMGVFASNYYARPVDDERTMTVDNQYTGGGGPTDLSLSKWKANFGTDLTSGKSLVSTDNADNLHFVYNFSSSPKTVSLDGSWKDIYSTLYQISYTLPSFKGKVFVSSLAGQNTSTLPLDEASFTATPVGSAIQLTWKGCDKTTSHFEVERSANGLSFTKIGTVSANLFLADSSYVFVDQTPFPSLDYYRLKMVDFNGSIEYSKIIVVKTARERIALQLFPNPASNVLTIKAPVKNPTVRLMVTDMSGRKMDELNVSVDGPLLYHTMDITNLRRGSYLLSIDDQSVVFVKQ